MKRRQFIVLGALTLTSPLLNRGFAQKQTDDENIGKISVKEFEAKNKEGARAVASVKATPEPLSGEDLELFQQVVAGGMLQLELSRLAVEKATDEDVKMLAQAEVAEQTGLSEKLKEIAGAKGLNLANKTSNAEDALAELRPLKAEKFDVAYIRESGVNGHELLQKTMERVAAKAADPSLKSLAQAALPLIKVHLSVSKVEARQLA